MGGVDMDGWIDTTAVLVFFLGLSSWDCPCAYRNMKTKWEHTIRWGEGEK